MTKILRRTSRRRPPVLAAVLAVLALIMAAIAGLAWRNTRPQPVLDIVIPIAAPAMPGVAR